MNILLIAPIHREKEFIKQRGKLPFVLYQGQQSWYDALTRMGHTVTVFRYTDAVLFPLQVRLYIANFLQRIAPKWVARYRRYSDKLYWLSLSNMRGHIHLIKLSKKYQPDMVFLSGGVTSLFPSTIQKIKQNANCPILLFSGINPQKGASTIEKILVKRHVVDVVIENDLGYADLWKKIGAKETIVLPISSADLLLHKKITLSKEEKYKYGSEICFVGSLSPTRQKKLKSLASLPLSIWGDVPPEYGLEDELKPFYHGPAHGAEMVKIFNGSKITINFQPEDMLYGGNMRTFEIPACGAFQLADKVDNRWFTDTKNIVLFDSIEDLKNKILYYLDNDDERKKIAEAGYKHVMQLHTYDKHFTKLLKFYEKKK